MTPIVWTDLAARLARDYVTLLAHGLGSTFTDTLTLPASWNGLASLSSRQQGVPDADRASYMASWTQTAAAKVCQIMGK